MSDEYRIVTTRLRALRPNSIFVDGPSGTHGSRNSAAWSKKTVSIPRSLIHGGDDLRLDSHLEGEEITFRLMAWKAEELGFA